MKYWFEISLLVLFMIKLLFFQRRSLYWHTFLIEEMLSTNRESTDLGHVLLKTTWSTQSSTPVDEQLHAESHSVPGQRNPS